MSDDDTKSSLSTKDTLVIIFGFVACVLILLCWFIKYICTRKNNPSWVDNLMQAFRDRENAEPRDHSTLVSENPQHDFQITYTSNSTRETFNIATDSKIEMHEPQQHFFIEETSSRLVPPPPTHNEPSCPHEKPPPSYEDACKYFVDK